jgi:hypothetical protein
VKSLATAALGLLLTLQPSSNAPLKFAWPVETAATVETEYLRQSGIEPPAELSYLRMTRRMRVLAHSDGYSIQFDDYRSRDARGDVSQAMQSLMSLWIETTVVGPDGRFIRIENAERAKELLLTDAAAIEKRAGQNPVAKDYLAQAMRPDALEIRQRQEWQKLVLQWLGATPSDDAVETTSTSQLVPGVDIPVQIRRSVVERVPCKRGAASFECVTFERRQTATPDGLKRSWDRLAGPGGTPGARPVDLEVVFRVTLETRTMLPHAVLQTQMMHIEAPLNGSTVVVTNFESHRSQYTYQ